MDTVVPDSADQLQVFLQCLQSEMSTDNNMYESFSPSFCSPSDRSSSPASLGPPDCAENNSDASSNSCDDLIGLPCDTDPIPDITEDPSSFMAQRRIQRLERSATFRAKKEGYPSIQLSPETVEDLLEEADLKRKRLARKAELARVSRKRKKMRIDELEVEVAQLQAELERERSKCARLEQAKPLPSARDVPFDCDKRLIHAIQSIVKTEQNSDPQHLVQMFYDAFTATANAANAKLEILKNFPPCLLVRFLKWVLSQTDKFYQDPGGLWTSLFSQEIGASPAQMAQLMTLRAQAKGARVAWSEVEAAGRTFENLLRRHQSESTKTLESFMGILTAPQLVSLFQWVDRFGPICVKINV